MNLFEFTLKLNGFPIKEATHELKQIQDIPKDNYQKILFEKRKEIVDFHLKNNTFYQSFVGNKTISKWEDIPILTKLDLQVPLQQRLTKGFTKKKCYVSKTSGSSGQPLIFAKDKFCHAMTWAEIMDRFSWIGVNFNTSLQARFYGIPLDFKNYQKEKIKDFLSHRVRFSIFDLSDDKLERFLTIFKKKKFYFINGHTSSLVLFAKFLQRKNIVLTSMCPSLKYCVVTSEMLYEIDQILLKKWIGTPIINEYGASEIDLIAFTNNQDEFIVNSETLFVEILDENNQAVAHGKPGRIIVTSLYNKAHPLIRYDVGDIGILAPSTTLKKPILQQLIGRSNDPVQLPSGRTVPGHTFYYVTKSVVEDDGNVKEFVIEQHQINHFKIIYVAEKKLTETEKNKIKKALATYLEQNLHLEYKKVALLTRNKSGKLKQFISKLHH